MKKNKIAAAWANTNNNINDNKKAGLVNDCLHTFKLMARMNNLKLLPTDNVNKLGVLYSCKDVNGEIMISFFDRSKVTSLTDVVTKAGEKRNDIVGEDCLYYPAQIMGKMIVPNWDFHANSTQGMIIGTLDFDEFCRRTQA